MYRRFLINEDYLSIITPEALNQMTRGNADRLIQAEECAEISVIEHLSENYTIEEELYKGKYIAQYNRQITFPPGVHILFEGKLYKVVQAISGFKAPQTKEYWTECMDECPVEESVKYYSQFEFYEAGDIVRYNGVVCKCIHCNGYPVNNVRIPFANGWTETVVSEWLPTNYVTWDVVRYQDCFYTLTDLTDYDPIHNPVDNPCWGAIADYDPNYNLYELNEHEYVVYEGRVFYPTIDVNADLPQSGVNLILSDPRNYNLKKHLLRLSVYELSKLISANNVSVVRLKDYEDSMRWLNDAGRLKINPQIPRKIANDNEPVTDWQISTFQSDYDPYKNPWFT